MTKLMHVFERTCSDKFKCENIIEKAQLLKKI